MWESPLFLLQILKREWPKNWESFIPDIIGASKTNESLCQNNMVILKLLSEEVFDFSCGQMTQTKAKHLKDTMCQQFQDVFSVCTLLPRLFLPLETPKTKMLCFSPSFHRLSSLLSGVMFAIILFLDSLWKNCNMKWNTIIFSWIYIYFYTYK